MHSTDELPVRPIDVVMGHHYTSTHPASHFTRTLTVARHQVDADGRPVHMTLTLDGLQIRRAGRRRSCGRWQTRRSRRCARRSALTSRTTKGTPCRAREGAAGLA
ncbi:arylamine N-acetyltransferase [Janibacter melonis]|uniref:arylamine N-acetyltransferase n=1 Tax=Janibacter melonis TaxID=262209 RepID=UPI002094DF53|nr:arylamine N-acetyltransferase [Janibacter melonis]